MAPSSGTTQRTDALVSVLPRWAILLRAGALLVVGLVITFSATLHENFAFDVGVIASGLALLGVVHLVEWSQRRGKTGAPIALILGIVSLVAAVLVFAQTTELALAIIIASWSLVCALLEFLGMTITPGSRHDAVIIGAIGMLLAVLVLVFRNDAVAVIGFFGGYAIIAGVFLAIAGFDTRRSVLESDTEAQSSPIATQVESER